LDINPLIATISSEVSYTNDEDATKHSLPMLKTGGNTDATSLQAVQAALYQRLIAKLDVSGYNTIFLAPDGALHLVPFEALRRPDGTPWIFDTSLSVRLLQTGRALAHDLSPPFRKGAVVLGGIDYDYRTMSQGVVSDKRRVEADLDKHAELLELSQQILHSDRRGAADASPVRAAPSFFRVNSSETEAQAVALFYSRVHQKEAVRLRLGKDATEANLKKSLPEPPRILHLATHGFYRAPMEPTDPLMLLSGVALAGANVGVGEDGEDGILYAMEAQNLNLEGTELVVLSACETGQGTIERGEGVYGFVRALRIAGVRNVLVTLRTIPDEDTKIFIERFYNNWLNDAEASPAAALEKTKRQFVPKNDIDWTPYVLISNAVLR
jgi:CHAT domain-containing protein